MGRFEKLYDEHAATVFRFARSCVNRREVAEEIVSEAFLALFQNLDQVEDSSLPAWLLTVTKRRAADYWRRWFLEGRHQSWSPKSLDETRAGGLEIHLAAWLEGCPRLTAVHRACLILRYGHGMNRTEIGERLGLTDNQVKGHLQYALQLMRKDLKVPKAGGAE